MAAKYLDVETGQDLIELGIKPKSSSRQMALVAYSRLTALRDHILAQVEDDSLGNWRPLVERGEDEGPLALAEGVVADRQMGHRLRLRRDFAGPPAVPAGTLGALWAHDAGQGTVTVDFELEDHSESDTQRQVTLSLEAAHEHLDVSTLGQLLPLDKQREVKAKVLAEFFPSTVLDTKRIERIIIALLMGKDLILYGPPGGGKSNIAKDIVEIARRGQPVIFVERNCQVQCSPFSIFDEKFAKQLDACPECKIRYDPEFKRTGRFRRPSASEVRVKPAAYGEGQGIEYVEGTVGLQRMHLAGHKIPRLDGATEGASDFDPEGFHAGILPHQQRSAASRRNGEAAAANPGLSARRAQ
jgi:hypothetical protein